MERTARFRSHRVPVGSSVDAYEFTVPTKYTNLRFINQGSQGIVVSAFDTLHHERVAIKKIRYPFDMPISAVRALREFALLMSINHPNIINTFSVFTPQQNVEEFEDIYLVMEHMVDPLASVISTVCLDHEALSRYICEILCAVDYLHRNKIVHRDLKPSNIMFNDRRVLKVLDFGLARTLNMERMSSYVVTRHYRAPEVLLNMSYSEKVDVWSIGCIFAEMITGRVLFPGDNQIHQWNMIKENLGTPSVQFISKLQPDIARVVSESPKPPKPFSEIFPDDQFPDQENASRYWTASDATRLLSKMLVIDPDQRCSAAEALEDPYVRNWNRHEENESRNLLESGFDIEDGTTELSDLKAKIFEEVKLLEAAELDGSEYS